MWEQNSKGWNSRLQWFRPVYSINSKTHFKGLISFFISCSLRMLLQSSQKLLIWPQVKTYYFSKTLIWVSKTHLKETRWKVAICSYEKVTDRKMKELWLLLQSAKVFHCNFFIWTFSQLFRQFWNQKFCIFLYPYWFLKNIGKLITQRTLQRKSHFCIPFLGILRSQSKFPHSWVCERFIYSQDRSTYFLQQNRQINRGNV